MEDLIAGVIELVGNLLEDGFKSIKNTKKRKWALTIFYSVVTLAIVSFCVWSAIAFYRQNNWTGFIVLAVIAGFLFLIFVFLFFVATRRIG